MNINTPRESQTFEELINNLQAEMNVEDKDLIHLFLYTIYQIRLPVGTSGNSPQQLKVNEFLKQLKEEGTWSYETEGDNYIITKNTGSKYKIKVEIIKKLDPVTNTLQPKRIPKLLERIHSKKIDITMHTSRAKGARIDRSETNEDN